MSSKIKMEFGNALLDEMTVIGKRKIADFFGANKLVWYRYFNCSDFEYTILESYAIWTFQQSYQHVRFAAI